MCQKGQKEPILYLVFILQYFYKLWDSLVTCIRGLLGFLCLTNHKNIISWNF